MTRAVDIEGRGVRVNGRSVGVGSEIPDEELLHAHYDFSKEDGSTPVEDQSGNNRDLTSGSYTGVTETINGTQAADFDGSDDGVYNSSIASLSEFSTFVVVDLQGSRSNNHTIVQHNDTDFTAIGWFGNGPNWRVRDASTKTNLSGSTDDLHQIHGYIERIGSPSSIRSNGTEQNTISLSSDLNAIGVGTRQPWGSGGEFAGAIGEVLIYETDLSSSQVSDVESYLADKWGITL